MSTLTVQPSGDELLNAVAGLDTNTLAHFVDEVLALQARRRSHILTHREADLLQEVNLGIVPQTWQRYDLLKAKRRATTLTRAEHRELIDIGDQIERANAHRIAALIELADLRHISLETLLAELGIQAPDVE